MSRLVVNADDAGLDAGTDDAILRCARGGAVRSATVVVNGPTAARFVARARAQGLDLGLHLNLTEGPSLAGPHATLTDASGRLALGKEELWRRACAGRLDPEEVRRELRAQWARLRDLGAEPTHVDGHNHVHLFPEVRAALAGLTGVADLWVRTSRPEGREEPPAFLPAQFAGWTHETGPWRRTDRFCGYGFSVAPSLPTFLDPLADVADAPVTEFMVHPGARAGSPFTESPDRDAETAILCAAGLKLGIERGGYVLGGFAEISSCGS